MKNYKKVIVNIIPNIQQCICLFAEFPEEENNKYTKHKIHKI